MSWPPSFTAGTCAVYAKGLVQDNDDPLSWIAQDSYKPGEPQGLRALWVAQADEAFSTTRLGKSAEDLCGLMPPLLCDWPEMTHDRVTHATTHLWRSAQVPQALGQPFARSADGTLYLGGDWCIGSRVEAAFGSGTAIADAILAEV